MCRSPALMNLTCPATHTTKLPSGRLSTNCLRLRSYSATGIPGVTSPCLTFVFFFFFYARIHQRCKAQIEWWWFGVAHSPRWVWDFDVGCPNVDGLVGAWVVEVVVAYVRREEDAAARHRTARASGRKSIDINETPQRQKYIKLRLS